MGASSGGAESTGGASPTAAPERPKVIYVMGQPRSGSTILGVALGNCAGVYFAGELTKWLLSDGHPHHPGEERERFWRDVAADVDGASEVFGDAAYEHFERGVSALRIDRWPPRRRLRAPYMRVTAALYRAIARRADAACVVDTSHLPLRARRLQQLDGVDLRLVFLVRRPEDILGSYMRRTDPRARAAARWRFLKTNCRMWGTYAISTTVFLRQPRDRRLLVRHEDFLADPEGCLRAMLAMADVPAELPDLDTLRPGSAFAGNPRVVREQTLALRAKPLPPYRTSLLMRLAERPWALVLARLRPTATDTAGPPAAAEPLARSGADPR